VILHFFRNIVEPNAITFFEMTLVRQQAFGVNKGDVRRNEAEGSRADVAAHLRPLPETTTNPDGRGRNGGNQNAPSDSMVDALAYKIANLDQKGIQSAVKNLERVRTQNNIPWDSPLATVGPFARPAVFQRSSMVAGGLRSRYSHMPYNGGRDGGNLSTSGKPFAFASGGYNAKAEFNPNSSDIPEDWASQMAGEMHNARTNQDHQYLRTALASGRYSHIRV
jgi:hypothetical protein